MFSIQAYNDLHFRVFEWIINKKNEFISQKLNYVQKQKKGEIVSKNEKQKNKFKVQSSI